MAATTKPTFSTTKPTLFWNKICPFVHRAWIVAVEKNVDLEYQYIPLGEGKPAWYAAEVNAAATVPCLMLPDGKVIRESNLVAQYLDENYGVKGALQAGNVEQKYQLRRFIAACGDGVIGAMYGLLMTPDDSAENAEKIKQLKEKVKSGLGDLERRYVAQSPAGPYFNGDNFSLADVTILPFLDRFRYTVAAYRGINILDGDYPRLKAMLAAAETRPSFALTAQPADFYVNCYKGYAKTEAKHKAVYQGTIYSAPGCPFCQRVKLANVLKGSPFEVVTLPWLEPAHVPDWSKSKIPNYKGESVPVIAYGGPDGVSKIIDESIELIQFVDEFSTSVEAIGKAEGNTIQPQDGVDAYETRFLTSELGETIGDFFQAFGGSNTEAAQAALTKLGYLESYYARQKNAAAGPYFLGETATFADCVALPFWVYGEVLYEKVLGKLPEANGKTFAEAFPNIGKSLAAARARDDFNVHLPSKAEIEKQME